MDVRIGPWRKLSAEKLMLLNCGFGEDSWESLGLQGDPTSPSWRRSVLGVHWKDWCWSWNSNTVATSCEELTDWKRPWCWEGLGARLVPSESYDRDCSMLPSSSGDCQQSLWSLACKHSMSPLPPSPWHSPWVSMFSHGHLMRTWIILYYEHTLLQYVVQSLSCVWLFVTPRTAALQASLSFTLSQSLFKFMSVELVMISNHLILCNSLLLLPSILPSIRVFPNEQALHIRYMELQLQHQSFQWIFRVDFL